VPDHFRTIYASKAALYDAMVSREDHEGNIFKSLSAILPESNIDIVELGAGTGRLTRLLLPMAKSIHACDASQHMLEVARSALEVLGDNWTLHIADNRRLPVTDGTADLAIAGWSLGHSCGWYPETWREEIDQAIAEMRRVLRPGGVMVILETLGTGQDQPAPPTPALAQYYQHLETIHGFSSTWIRTDYRFASVEEADRLTRFFFGDALADRIQEEQLIIVPECTGIWWHRLE
jgi:ubiquinone/menaquinone biosynthesis C-methylase UbiE